MNNETSGKETASAPLCSPKLPVEKVQRIAKNDPEYMDTSDDAFVATAYDDISAAIVHSSDGHLQFLNDVIPTTKNLRLLVEENRVRYTTSVMPPNEVYSAYVVNDTAPKPNIVEIDLDNDEDDDEDVTDQE